MNSTDDIKRCFQNSTLSTNRQRHEAIFQEIQRAQEQSKEIVPSLSGFNLRRTIIKNPITRLATAAAVIAVVVLGLSEFIGTGSTSGVVWAEVARKVEASRGLIVRCTESFSSVPESLSFLNDSDYAIKYVCPTHSRTDDYKGGKIIECCYNDFTDAETQVLTCVYHKHKRYLTRTCKRNEHKFLLEQHDDWLNPMYLVETILSSEHRKLARKTIDGVLCEGIETTDPASMGPLPGPVDLLDVELRLWVDAETKYPVLFESKISIEAEGQAMSSEGVMDRFQWDVELDPSIFEPKIPPDYKDMRSL